MITSGYITPLRQLSKEDLEKRIADISEGSAERDK